MPAPGVSIGTDDLSDQINTGNPDTSAVIHTNGLKWGSSSFGSGATVSYSFLSSVPSYYSTLSSKYGIDYPSGFIGFNTAQKNATREILSMYSDVANINFVETTGVGTLTFANHSMGSGVGAYAYYPNLQRIFPSDTAPLSGDVWVSNANRGTSLGSWGYLTLIHEIGHAIGLKHPGNYNASGGGTDGPYLPSNKDNHQYTVMSYHDHPYHSTSPVSPLLFDIAAVQFLYGVNNSTRTGNDTYTVSYYGEIKAIWDAGGNDTLSAAGTSRNATIRLEDGDFSSINGTNNIAIAYGAVIENATGGTGNDYLYGNSSDNRLDGGSGTDRLYGRSGNDTLIGGSSTDYLYGENGNDALYGDSGNDVLEGGSGRDYLVGGDGNDILRGGSDFDNLLGGNGNDTLYSNGGDDFLKGEGGNDTLYGEGESEIATYSGYRSEYAIEDFGSYFRISDMQAGRDGVDTLFNVRKALFKDGTVNLGAPEIVLTNASVNENAAAGTLVGVATLVPPPTSESFTFSIVNNYSGLFRIGTVSGEITTSQALDHETLASYDLDIAAFGSSSTTSRQVFTISVVDVNEAPEDIDDTPAFVVAENAAIGDTVGTVVVNDPDAGDSHTFELTDNAGGLFSIDASTGEISVAGTLDFETAASHQITIKGTDSGGLSNEWTRTVTVNNVNEAPETEGRNVVMAQGAVASAQLTATDDDGDAVTFSLSEGAANGTVTLSADGFYTYTPNSSFIGSDSFIYSVSDGEKVTDEVIDVTIVSSGDMIVGQADSELLIASDVGSKLDGQGGDDKLYGGAGADTLIGGDGDDVLIGDRAVGGSGSSVSAIVAINPETLVDTPSSEFALGQSNDVAVAGDILALPDGGYIVVWAGTSRTDDVDLAFQRYDADGNEVGEEVIVDSALVGPTDAQDLPRLLGFADGSFLLAWASTSQDRYSVNAQRFDQNSNPVGSEIVLYERAPQDDEGSIPTNAEDIALVSQADGGYGLVVNMRTSNAITQGNGIEFLSFDSTGEQQQRLHVPQSQENGHFDIRTATLVDDSFVVSWAFGDPDAGNIEGVAFRQFGSDGLPAGSETVVDTGGESLLASSQVVGLSDGRFAILWHADQGATGETRVSFFTDDGESDGSSVLLPQLHFPTEQIVATSDGGFLIVNGVFEDGGHANPQELVATHYNSSGVQVGESITLTETTGSTLEFPRVEVLSSGEVVIVWTNSETPGVGLGQIQRRISFDDVPATGTDDSTANDTLIGGAGDDVIDGGGGDDVVVFEGRVLDYTITEDGTNLIVQDTVADRDGTDILTNVERARFADGEFTLDGSAQLAFSDTTVDEDVAAGGEVATVGAVFGAAGASFTYELTDDAGGTLSIDATTGAISTLAGLDHETAPSLDISVRATGDQGTIIDKDVTISVADVNEAPADTDDTAPLVIAENADIGDAVGTIIVSDQDAGDSHTFDLLDDAGGLFTIDAQTGVVSVAGALDHETASSLTITVRATDSGGLSNQWDHTVSITDVNEAPDGGGALAAAGTEDNDVAFSRTQFEALFSDQDAGDTLQSIRIDTLPVGATLLLGGAAVGAGSVIAVGDLDSLVFRPDTDVNGSIGFDISFSDGELFSETSATVTVTLDPVNDVPVNIDLTPVRVLEGSAAGTVAATVEAIDVDAGDTHTFSLDDDAGGLFEIDAVTGVITVSRDITTEETGAHEIIVRATDAGGLENTWTRTLTLDGDETLTARSEAETIDGGSGTDTIDFSNSSAGVTVDLAAGTGAGGDAEGDTFGYVLKMCTGSGFDDTLTGDEGANVLAGGAGDDMLNAGAGDDLYSFAVGDGSDTIHDNASYEESHTETEAYTAYRTEYRTVWVTNGEGNSYQQQQAYQQAYTAYRDITVTEIFEEDGGVDGRSLRSRYRKTGCVSSTGRC